MILNLANNEAKFIYELVLHKGKFDYLLLINRVDYEKLLRSLERHNFGNPVTKKVKA
jgi:hypothetical protein